MTSTCTLEQIEQMATDVEYVWTEFTDQPVMESATATAMSLRLLGATIRISRGLPLSTDGHLQFKPEDSADIWCHESCPMPEDLCGALAVQQNA